jgi:hypothetical protein
MACQDGEALLKSTYHSGPVHGIESSKRREVGSHHERFVSLLSGWEVHKVDEDYCCHAARAQRPLGKRWGSVGTTWEQYVTNTVLNCALRRREKLDEPTR